MFFKTHAAARTLLAIAGLCLILGVTSGCGIHFGEKAPPPTPPRMSGSDYACVGQIPEHLELYFNDKLSEEQISEFALCMQKAFIAFAQMTRGRDVSVYSPEEIRGFLQGSFLKDRPISDSYMHQLMLIKQLLIGGSSTSIERKELDSLIQLFDEIGKEANRLKPHIKVLNPRLADEQDPDDLGERLENASEALDDFIQVVTARLQKSPTDYRFSDLQIFMAEFRKFAHWEEHFKDILSEESWVNMLKIFKELAVSPLQPEAIRPTEWNRLFKAMANWYFCYLQYRVGVKAKSEQPGMAPGPSFFEGVRLRNVVFLGNRILKLVDEALNRQPYPNVIRYERLFKLIESLQALNWFPRYIERASLEAAVPKVLSRVFHDVRQSNKGQRAEGLKLGTVDSIKEAFDRWAFIQQGLERRYHGGMPDIGIEVPGYPILRNDLLFPRDIRAEIEEVGKDSDWEEFERGIKPDPNLRPKMRPLFSEDHSTLVKLISDPMDFRRYQMSNGFYNLSMMNLFRTVVTLIMRGYAADEDRNGWNSGIGEEELQEFYLDVRPIGINIGILDPRSQTAGARSFAEGTLFTYTAKGIEFNNGKASGKLGVYQGMELASILFSGGQLANRFYSELAKICRKGEPDFNCKPKIERQCVEENLANVIASQAVNMPGVQSFLSKASDGVRHNYAASFLKGAYHPKSSNPQWVEQSELSIMAVVLHYVEVVMTSYDGDHNGILEWQEIEQAMPTFLGFIEKFSAENKKTKFQLWKWAHQPESAFLFTILNQKFPSGAWDLFLRATPEWTFRSLTTLGVKLDRADLAEVFQAIISAIMQGSAAIKEPVAACQN